MVGEYDCEGNNECRSWGLTNEEGRMKEKVMKGGKKKKRKRPPRLKIIWNY